MKSDPLIIAGSGRSGTTWVLDVLAGANNLRPIFEPLNPRGVTEAQRFCNCYVREGAYEPELRHFMERVFNGELNSLWTNTRILPNKIRPSVTQITSWDYSYTLLSLYKRLFVRYFSYLRRRSCRTITKFISANLMLDWLRANFNSRIVYVVRHPGSVAASQISASRTKDGAVWDFYGPVQQKKLIQYKHDEQLRKDYLDQYYEIFSKELSPVAGYTLLWCIENILPIYNLQKKEQHVFFYEDIVTNPEKEFSLMVNILGLDRHPDMSSITRPSQQASQEMKNESSAATKLTRWLKCFSQKELNEIDEILKFFNVTTYNAYEPMPISRRQDSA
jgi:hypothetical protein